MRELSKINNPYNDDKIISQCSIFGMMNLTGDTFSGCDITKAIANMHDRGNGLGGGFAVYGLYPKYKDFYVFHIMFLTRNSKENVEKFLGEHFQIVATKELPTRKSSAIKDPPLVWRYFLEPISSHLLEDEEPDDFIVEKVMEINREFEGAFVFSSGKDMGVFKGVGFPEEISEYFCLEDYEGYLWTAHGRFPTNTQGWWGGAHPFNILDWTVVHNGEISSYGINRRFLEMYGYDCTMHTDTEVMAYAVDLLMRRHKLNVEVTANILAPHLWTDIDRMNEGKSNFYKTLRQVYGSLLMNGPFTVIIAHQGEMIGLTDRIRLRPLTAGMKGNMLYLSSEEASIRLICPDLEKAWIPVGGEPIVGKLKTI